MLVDFRNDLMKHFHENSNKSNQASQDKNKKPNLHSNSTKKETINHSVFNVAKKNLSNYLVHRVRSPIKNPKFKLPKSLISNFTDHCFQRHFFEKDLFDFTSNEKKKIIIQPVINEIPQKNDEKCPYLLNHWFNKKLRKCDEYKRKKENNSNYLTLYEQFQDIDLGVESIFKVLTKHIKVKVYYFENLFSFFQVIENKSTNVTRIYRQTRKYQ